MARNNTGNPVPSASPLDREDNSKIFDELVTSKDKEEVPDRLGAPLKTWHKIQKGIEEQLIAGGQIFPDEPTGRAAVSNGQYFYSESDDPNVSRILWRRVSSSSSDFIADDPSYFSVWQAAAAASYLQPAIDNIGLSERLSPDAGYMHISENKKLLMQLDKNGYRYEVPISAKNVNPDSVTLSSQKITFFDRSEYELSGLSDLGEYVLSENKKLIHAKEPFKHTSPETSATLELGAQQLIPAILGDSRSANASSPTPQGLRTNVGGWPFWCELFSSGGFRYDSQYNYAIAGESSTEIVTRAEAAAKSGANCVIYHAEINDALGDDSIGNARFARDLCLAEGKLFIIIAETPRGTTSPANWDAARRAQHAKYRQEVLSWRNVPGVRVVDVMPEMIDPYSNIGAFKDDLSSDGLHYTTTGVLTLAKSLIEQTSDLFVKQPGLVASNADVYDAAHNKYGNLLSNGMMAGAGGNITGTGSITGDIADGWTLNCTSSFSGTASKEIDDDGRVWQRIVFSGNPVNNSQIVEMYQSVSISDLSAGDKIEAMIEIDVDDGSVNMFGPELNVSINGSSNVLSSGYMIPATTYGPNPSIAYRGFVRTPDRYVIPDGLSALEVRIRVRANMEQAVTASFRVTAASLKKVV